MTICSFVLGILMQTSRKSKSVLLSLAIFSAVGLPPYWVKKRKLSEFSPQMVSHTCYIWLRAKSTVSWEAGWSSCWIGSAASLSFIAILIVPFCPLLSLGRMFYYLIYLSFFSAINMFNIKKINKKKEHFIHKFLFYPALFFSSRLIYPITFILSLIFFS